MVSRTPARPSTGPGPEEAAPVRLRDADGTRQRLLRAARCRFARDGYSSTTVREIAADAGVNVALINRYFSSKEGLFTACLQRVVEDLGRQLGAQGVDQLLDSILGQLTDAPSGEPALHLLLLLRSSGDERADEIRRRALQAFAERIAAAAGHGPEDLDDELLLRAQVALSTALGIVLLRSSTGLEPLTSATAAELREPVGATLVSLLSRSDRSRA
jgi:AcrR family transcriptional regulator